MLRDRVEMLVPREETYLLTVPQEGPPACRKHQAQSLGGIKNRTLAMSSTGLIGQRLGRVWKAAGKIILTLQGFGVISAYQLWLWGNLWQGRWWLGVEKL